MGCTWELISAGNRETATGQTVQTGMTVKGAGKSTWFKKIFNPLSSWSEGGLSGYLLLSHLQEKCEEAGFAVSGLVFISKCVQ